MILNLESSQFSFTADEVDSPSIMGRDDDCKFVVESSSVSRKHAELVCAKGIWTVKDLGSRYGTTVNGKSAVEPTPMATGDVLKLGTQSFLVNLMASNDMLDLGRHLSGGKLKGLIGAATAKRPENKTVLARKKGPAKATMMFDKDDDESAASPPAGAADESPKAEDEGAKEVVSENAPKTSKKMSMRRAVAKKTSPVVKAIKAVVLLGVLAGVGIVGWKYYQQQQSAPPAGTGNGAANATPAQTPPPSEIVALPGKGSAKVIDVTPEAKPDEKAVAAPEKKAEEKVAPAAEIKPEEKTEPKSGEKPNPAEEKAETK